MKRTTWILTVLAVILVLTSSIGGALAYFTDREETDAGLLGQAGNNTTITETVKVGDGSATKTVQITNEGTTPVFVRFLAIAGPGIGLSAEGTDWTAVSPVTGENDGYIYYSPVLEGGVTTSDLTVTITFPADPKSGDEANVAVLYESVPAIYAADGTPDLATAWKRGVVTVIR